MTLRKNAFRGSMVLTVGEAAVYGLSFARNMILARLLTKADFGIAATFAMIMMLLEFSAKLGIGRLVVQDKEGDEPPFQATAHLVQVTASLVSSLIMAVAAWPMATLLGIREQVAAIFVLAAIPLLHGFNHLDVRRFERSLRFGPSALVDVIPQVVITLLAWPVAWVLPDYRAVLVLMIVKALLSLAGSHGLAKRPYRWAVDKTFSLRMLRFGWPLLINGFLMFFMLRGDQFIVASFYQMSDFGAYAAAASLMMAPTFFFRRVCGSVMLPLMAKVQDVQGMFDRRYSIMITMVCVFSVAYGVTIIIGAEVLMQFVFGRKYEGAGVLLAWLTAANAVRNIRLAPAVAAIAKGDSINQMISNFAGGAGLLLALLFATLGRPLWMIAASGLVGEALASTVSFCRLAIRERVPLKTSLWPVCLVICSIAGAGMVLMKHAQASHPLSALLFAGAVGVLFSGVAALALPDARREVRRLVSTCRSLGMRNTAIELKNLFLAKGP